jgi:hypothetical protein
MIFLLQWFVQAVRTKGCAQRHFSSYTFIRARATQSDMTADPSADFSTVSQASISP